MRIHNDGNDEPMGLRLKILFHDHAIMLLNLYFCKLLGSIYNKVVLHREQKATYATCTKRVSKSS